jgi:hypothetical protein
MIDGKLFSGDDLERNASWVCGGSDSVPDQDPSDDVLQWGMNMMPSALARNSLSMIHWYCSGCY